LLAQKTSLIISVAEPHHIDGAPALILFTLAFIVQNLKLGAFDAASAKKKLCGLSPGSATMLKIIALFTIERHEGSTTLSTSFYFYF
jgi:hypothetical protein